MTKVYELPNGKMLFADVDEEHHTATVDVLVLDSLVEAVNKTAWIPVDEDLPTVNDDGESGYILLSFENFPNPCIGKYREDEDGGGAFYEGDDDKSLSRYGLIVNAWMPCPERYEED